MNTPGQSHVSVVIPIQLRFRCNLWKIPNVKIQMKDCSHIYRAGCIYTARRVCSAGCLSLSISIFNCFSRRLESCPLEIATR